MNPIEKSLKRKEGFYSEEPVAKNLKTESASESETKWVDFEEIQKDLISKFKDLDAFPQRVTKFCKYMEDPSDRKKIYITIDAKSELCICLTIQKKTIFESEALSQDMFVENKKVQSFIEIKLHESIYNEVNEDYEDNEFLNIRCNETGNLNELVKIEKTKTISGTKGMELFEMIVPWFKLRKVSLYDDAQLSYTSKEGIEQFLSLRKSLIFRDQGLSWYEKKGFTLYNCEDMPVFDQSIKLTQGAEDYLHAKKEVSMTPLNTLYNFMLPFPDVCYRVILLQQKYLPNAKDDSTIYDLVSKIVQVSQSNTAMEDLSFFFNKCMLPWSSSKETPDLQKYLKALQVIEDARIYIKEYK